MIQRLGRAYGPGQLKLVQRGAGAPQWTLSWRDEHGVRRQRALSTDRRVAERRMREIIHRRDLALEGVGVDGRDMALEELARLYLEELRSRCVDAHYVNSKSMIERALAGIGVQRVGDLLPLHALKYRTQLLASGAAPRTANLHVDRVSAMLAWGVKVGLLHRNPLEHIDRLRDTGGHARYQRRALSADEITRLLESWAQKIMSRPRAPRPRPPVAAHALYGTVACAYRSGRCSKRSSRPARAGANSRW